jgi:hypothetical protein
MIIESLFSFEKFLSKYPPTIAIKQKTIANTQIVLLESKSKTIPCNNC